MLNQCTQAASNIVSADACRDAMLHVVAASPTIAGLAIAGAILASAIFATVITKLFF